MGLDNTMTSSSFRFPDLSTITFAINSGIRDQGFASGHLKVLSRELPSRPSTYPCEIINCQTEDDRELRLFCKYGVDYGYRTRDHRGGVEYEATVYRHVLMLLTDSIPTFYGAHKDSMTGNTWLILGYLENSTHASFTHQFRDMPMAARWIARFHVANVAYPSKGTANWLKRYDDEYYLNWARRTSLSAGRLHQSFPWLTTLCERFEECVGLLLSPPLTAIHGEYYPGNIVFCDGAIYPVDWESAAIAAGEIDLASLTEGWQPEIVKECEFEYKRIRWPSGVPINFERTLTAARLYLHFRWLGERSDCTTLKNWQWRFEELHSGGEKLGLI